MFELTYLLAMLSCLTFSSIAISSKISLICSPSLRWGAFVSESGCKSTPLPLTNQMFSHLFFVIFYKWL